MFINIEEKLSYFPENIKNLIQYKRYLKQSTTNQIKELITVIIIK